METKADSKYKIVGAASIAAKVTRDACLEEFIYEERFDPESGDAPSNELGSGYPSGEPYNAWVCGIGMSGNSIFLF